MANKPMRLSSGGSGPSSLPSPACLTQSPAPRLNVTTASAGSATAVLEPHTLTSTGGSGGKGGSSHRHGSGGGDEDPHHGGGSATDPLSPAAAAAAAAAAKRTADALNILTGAGLSGASFAVGDVFVQRVVDRRPEVDLARLARLTLFGLLLKGPCSAAFYRQQERFFPGVSAPSLLRKLLVDQGPWSWLVNLGFLTYLPVAEGAKGAGPAFEEACAKIVPLQISAYKLWPAALFVNYRFVPAGAGRLMFVNGVSVVWTAVMCATASHHSGKDSENLELAV